MLSYHNDFKAFPIGNVAPPLNSAVGGWWGFQARILPYTESKTIFQLCNFAYQGSCFDYIASLQAKGIRLGTMIPPYFKCPDDPLMNPPAIYKDPTAGDYGCTNYLGAMGSTSTANDGILFHGTSSTVINLTKITDGASHTIIMGERGVSNDLYGWPYCGAGMDNSGWGDNLMDTSLGLSKGWPDGNHNTHFWSYHPGIDQFLCADGSAHPLSYSVDFKVFQALSTRAGHEVISMPFN